MRVDPHVGATKSGHVDDNDSTLEPPLPQKRRRKTAVRFKTMARRQKVTKKSQPKLVVTTLDGQAVHVKHTSIPAFYNRKSLPPWNFTLKKLTEEFGVKAESERFLEKLEYLVDLQSHDEATAQPIFDRIHHFRRSRIVLKGGTAKVSEKDQLANGRDVRAALISLWRTEKQGVEFQASSPQASPRQDNTGATTQAADGDFEDSGNLSRHLENIADGSESGGEDEEASETGLSLQQDDVRDDDSSDLSSSPEVERRREAYSPDHLDQSIDEIEDSPIAGFKDQKHSLEPDDHNPAPSSSSLSPPGNQMHNFSSPLQLHVSASAQSPNATRRRTSLWQQETRPKQEGAPKSLSRPFSKDKHHHHHQQQQDHLLHPSLPSFPSTSINPFSHKRRASASPSIHPLQSAIPVTAHISASSQGLVTDADHQTNIAPLVSHQASTSSISIHINIPQSLMRPFDPPIDPQLLRTMPATTRINTRSSTKADDAVPPQYGSYDRTTTLQTEKRSGSDFAPIEVKKQKIDHPLNPDPTTATVQPDLSFVSSSEDPFPDISKAALRSLENGEYLTGGAVDDLIAAYAKRAPNVFVITYGWWQTHIRNILKHKKADQTVLLFPVCDALHWTLVLVDTQLKVIRHFDSLKSTNTISDAIVSRLKQYGIGSDFTLEQTSCIKQSNGFDCGIHVIVNAIFLMSGLKAPQQIDSKRWRQHFRECIWQQFVHRTTASPDVQRPEVGELALLATFPNNPLDFRAVQTCHLESIRFGIRRQLEKLFALDIDVFSSQGLTTRQDNQALSQTAAQLRLKVDWVTELADKADLAMGVESQSSISLRQDLAKLMDDLAAVNNAMTLHHETYAQKLDEFMDTQEQILRYEHGEAKILAQLENEASIAAFSTTYSSY